MIDLVTLDAETIGRIGGVALDQQKPISKGHGADPAPTSGTR
jgi:hypothetical protein